MLEPIGKLPLAAQIVVVVTLIFVILLSIVYLLLVLRDAIDERRRDRERERRERQKLYDSVLRIARACERIGDILSSTELLSTVEVTEERVIPYGYCLYSGHNRDSINGRSN